VRLGQGRENAKQFLKESPDLANEIEVRVREALGTRGLTNGTSSSNGRGDDESFD
jgi:recombination protein RecA